MNLSPWMNSSNVSAEGKTATLEAMRDEMQFQYGHEGYDLGFRTADANSVQPQEGLLYVETPWVERTDETADIGGDNITGCNPWGQATRPFAAVVAPYEGVAFSVKSPMAYLSVQDLLLLGNAFEYEGTVYQMTKNTVYSYDASLETVTAGDIDSEAMFPGMDETGADATNGTFRYAAALYNQAEKWNGKTVGIPSGDTVLTEDGYTYYQAFEGPDGVMYIAGDATAIGDADPNVPTEAAFVLDGDDQAALLAATSAADVAAALAQTGAPVMARPESGKWEFAKGFIENGSFTAYSAAQLVERKIAAIPAIPEGGIADQATYDAIEAAYQEANNAYIKLSPAEQEDVENAGILKACEAALAAYDAAVKAAAEVDKMLKMLNDLLYDVDKVVADTTTDFAEQIKAAEDAYNKLTEAAKKLVENYDYLQDAKDTMAAAAVVTEYYQKVPADYQEAWGAKYKDEASYLEGAEYAQYVKPLENAVNELTEDALGELEKSSYMTGIQEVIDWRPEENPEPERYTIEDVMRACRILARISDGGEPTDEELERYDLVKDDHIRIEDVMAICRQLATYN